MDLKIIEAYEAARPMATKPFRSACYAPFTSLLFDTTGVVRACCVNHGYVLGDVRENRLKEIWNGPRIQALRESLKNYDFTRGCGYCEWKISLGDFTNKNLTNSSIITYKFDHLTVSDGETFWPKHMEFHVSNTCNLACATCWGEFSSIIRTRREKLPPMPKAYGEEFFEDLAEFLPHLEEAMFLGGEPFLIREHERIWEMLIERGLRPQCHVVTNGTQYNAKVQRILAHLPMNLSVSVDGATKETFEKIRVNAKFDEVIANIKRLQSHRAADGTHVSMITTLSRLNWFEFADILLLGEELGLEVSVANLFEPRRFSLYTLGANEIRDVLEQWDKRNSELESKLTRNLQVWRNHTEELREHYRRFNEASPATPKQGDHSPSDTEADRFARELAEWSSEFPVIRVDHDENFVIEAIHAPADLSNFSNALLGQTTDDLIVAMKREFGTRINLLDEVHSPVAIRREVQFQDPLTKSAYLVRLGSFSPGPGKKGKMIFSAQKKLDARLHFEVRPVQEVTP